MTNSTLPDTGETNSLRKAVSVRVPPEAAWRVFTQKMSAWWPLATHKIGDARAVEAVVEPRVGGRWYERGEDGSTCDWGRVLAWEPPSRLVLSWEITPDWRHDPNLRTDVEVRFSPEGTGGTRVELEHRHLDRFGARRDEMRGIFDSESGWSGLLASFARAAGAGA